MMDLIKKIYSLFLKIVARIFGIDAAKIFDSLLRFNKKLDLRNPKTLADKVSFLELHDCSNLAPTCSDKYAVRIYVKEKGFESILIPLIGGPWERVSDIPFYDLPNSFVLKATHGCKMNYFVSNKDSLDVTECSSVLNKWLDTTYGTYSLEPHYALIKPRIIAEEYLKDLNSVIDYKFHCMNGKPIFVLVCSERDSSAHLGMSVTLDLFDMNWCSINGLKRFKNEVPGNGCIKKPSCFDEMKEIAQKLSADFKFVRVDLYEVRGKVYFGELTFSPACCVFPNWTDEFNLRMGEYLSLN